MRLLSDFHAAHPYCLALRAHRERQAISQVKLAARIGIVPHHLSKWELGRVFPTLPNLIIWADSLGLELSIQPKVHADA